MRPAPIPPPPASPHFEGTDKALLQRFLPLRGEVEVDDVAQLIAFLASDAARGYHGTCISIDNGATAG